LNYFFIPQSSVVTKKEKGIQIGDLVAGVGRQKIGKSGQKVLDRKINIVDK
jgi:hypothetical protein